MSASSGLENQLTATGYILNSDRSKILLLFHHKLQKWVPPGGHVEQNELPHECVLREVAEETGISADFVSVGKKLRLLGEERQLPQPYCILHELIPAYGATPEHMHVDFIYLMTVSPDAHRSQTNEQIEQRWFSLSQLEHIDCFEAVKVIAKTELKK